MKKIGITILLFLSLNPAFANCDLKQFRWESDLRAQTKPSRTTYSLVYCGNSRVYLTEEQWETLACFQRDNVKSVLKVNGEYVSSPCIPAERFLSFP